LEVKLRIWKTTVTGVFFQSKKSPNFKKCSRNRGGKIEDFEMFAGIMIVTGIFPLNT
jgi:hypothetical protein